MTPPEATLPHLQRDELAPPHLVAQVRDEPGGDGAMSFPGPDGHTIWVITRYDDVRAVLADHQNFSSAQFKLGDPAARVAAGDAEDDETGPPHAEDTERSSGAMLTADPPEHTRLRRLLSGQFTVKRVRWLEPRVHLIVDRCLEAMRTAGPPVDLVAAFALPVPGHVICELLGVPEDDRDEFRYRLMAKNDPTTDAAEIQRLDAETRAYLQGLVETMRARPGGDILGMLIREHGEELTDSQLVAIADLLLFAGHETTANMLSLGTVALLRNPDQRDRLCNDPDLAAPAVEELLRFLSVLQMTIPRTATADTTVAGCAVACGDLVMVSLPSANRDPRQFPDGDQLDLARPSSPHLAFGHGIHHCLGAALARSELAIALPALLQAFPRLQLATSEVSFRSAGVFHGVRDLPVSW